MKYLLVMLLSALIVPFIMFRLTSTNQPAKQSKTQASPNPLANLKTISYQDQNYRYDFFKVSSANQLKLISNLQTKISSTSIIVAESCQYLINGGFYSKNFTPIGLLKISGHTISQTQNNQLFNGFLSASPSGQLYISGIEMTDANNALQSGPILVDLSKPQQLRIQNDEPERRMIAITDADQNTYFFIIIGPESSFNGPTLMQLPQIALAIAQKENISLESAINLDGGTASVFYNGPTHIKEASPVGTYLCFQ